MKIVSSEDLRVTTMGGTAVLFEAGVPREISEEIGLLAIQQGAKELKGSTVVEEVIDVSVAEEATVEEAVQLDSELVTVLEKMMDEGNPDNFKADGYPKAAAVNKAVGRTVDTDAREAAWESILNS